MELLAAQPVAVVAAFLAVTEGMEEPVQVAAAAAAGSSIAQEVLELFLDPAEGEEGFT